MNFFYRKFDFCDCRNLVCTLLLTFSGYSQKCTFRETYPEINTDSLERWLILNPKIDENRLKNLIKIERKYSWERNSNRYKYLNEIEKTAKKLKNLHGIAYFKFHKAELLNEEFQNNRCVKLLREALYMVEELNDISGQISILSYLSLMYLNHGTSGTHNLAKYYIFKAKNLLSQSNDPHAKILFLVVYTNYEVSSLESSNSVKLSIISQLLQFYNTSPTLEYAHLWVKLIESNFNYSIKNYERSNVINNELLKIVKPNDFYLLSTLNLNLAKNYIELRQFDNALISNKLAIRCFHKTPKIVYYQQTRETSYAVQIAILNNYRSIAIFLNNYKYSAALADSIIYYQRLELENENKTIYEIQTRYRFEWSESELKDLAIEKKISQLLQNKLQIGQSKFKVLLFKNDLEQSEKKIKKLQDDTEKQLALAKSKIIENKNQLLYIYILMISILLILLVVSLFILRTYYRRERKRTIYRDQFYTILTHDLRGSINSLTGMGDVLSHLIKHKKTEEMGVLANKIDYLGYNTSVLLDNMLDWGTSMNYGVNTTPQSLDISLFLNELVGRYLAALKTKNINISINGSPNLFVITSPKCVDVIIRNLIDNAMSHTPTGGKIDINVKELRDSNQVIIEVSDTGEGIISEKLEFIKQVFLGKVKPDVGDGGVGLGMLLISYFAKKNKINLKVTSEVGNGSCFTLMFNTQGLTLTS